METLWTDYTPSIYTIFRDYRTLMTTTGENTIILFIPQTHKKKIYIADSKYVSTRVLYFMGVWCSLFGL